MKIDLIEDLSVKDCLKIGCDFLRNFSIETFKIDCEVILSFVLNVDRSYLLCHDDKILSNKIVKKFFELIKKRSSNQPIAQIIGTKEFWKNSFYINRSTLIPRPETELLIESVLSFFSNKEEKLFFADFGAGTGCIGASILNEYKNSRCVFIERNKNAAKMIKKNNKNLGLSSRSVLINRSWNDFHMKKKLDFIVSNPPYISIQEKNSIMKDVVGFEPLPALFAKNHGLKCYHDIMRIAKDSLKKGGYLFFEIDKNYQSIKIPYYFELKKIEKDLLGLNRVMVLKLR